MKNDELYLGNGCFAITIAMNPNNIIYFENSFCNVKYKPIKKDYGFNIYDERNIFDDGYIVVIDVDFTFANQVDQNNLLQLIQWIDNSREYNGNIIDICPYYNKDYSNMNANYWFSHLTYKMKMISDIDWEQIKREVSFGLKTKMTFEAMKKVQSLPLFIQDDGGLIVSIDVLGTV